MIDMHCHLDLYDDPLEVSEQCKLRNLYVLSVTTTPKAWKGTCGLAKEAPRIQTALGLHPQLAHERHKELELFEEILPATKYVGEIGLDGGKYFKQYQEIQTKVFKHILLTLNNGGGRIMSIHSYKSVGPILSLLKTYPNSGLPILHWFTGSVSELKDAIALGCWFSVNPSMLGSKRGRSLISLMPKARIVPESDGPFAKYKGKQLLPWQVEIVYGQLAELWQVPIDTVQNMLLDNFRVLVKQ